MSDDGDDRSDAIDKKHKNGHLADLEPYEFWLYQTQRNLKKPVTGKDDDESESGETDV